ncbi:MAG: helix-turn-helix transcriptional regulator [Arcobacteraceae bacterium]|jgi:transcriptional regulator with XRE-family HTH domain|nr:helix-turn-helix transcriptional regulator [Arcobacteraceae bacterium]
MKSLQFREFTEEDIQKIHSTIGKNVAKIRKEKGISQLELGLAIGHKSATVVTKSEIGLENKHFSIEHLYRIACVLDVKIEAFFDELEYI